MLEFCKVKNKTRIQTVQMDCIRRIESNVFSVALLSNQSINAKGTTYYKLPMGLLLRSCFIDSILALYIGILPTEEGEEEIDVMNKDYVSSLYKSKEVYVDRILSDGIDPALSQWYESQIEDTFPKYLKFTGDEKWFAPLLNKEIRKNSYSNDNTTIAKQYKYLQENYEYPEIADHIYAYYKYFSQYEHFSEYSHGDTFADYGLDNVHFPSALTALHEAIEQILQYANIND